MLPKSVAILTTVRCSGSVNRTISATVTPNYSGYWLLPLRDLLSPPFQNRFHLRRELIRQRPIDQAMIERQREIGDGPDRYRIVDHDRSFLDCAHTQNRHLRLIDYRRREHAAEAPEIGDRESPSLHLFRPQMPRPRSRREIRNRALQPDHA